MARKVDPEDIVALFRGILGRSPESEQVIAQYVARHDLAEAARVIAHSDEFRAQIVRKITAKDIGSVLPSAETRIVFVHIPKTGGTSLHRILTGWFGSDAVHPERYNGLYDRPAASLAAYKVFSGHFDFYSTQLVPGPKLRLLMLRDPIERLVSFYNFLRAQMPGTALSRQDRLIAASHEMSIDDFFGDSSVRGNPMIDNALTRTLSNLPLRSGTDASDCTLMSRLHAEAMTNLAVFDGIGFVDDMAGSVDRFARLLGKEPPAIVPREQVLDEIMRGTPGVRHIDRQLPSDRSLAAMDPLVQFDRDLVAAARARMSGPGPAT